MGSSDTRFLSFGGDIGGLPPAFVAPRVTYRLTGTSKVIAHFNRMREQFGNSERWLKRAAKTYHEFITKNMLSGQRLKVRSGKLRDAWRYERAGRNRYLVHPGMLPYARIHEFGHKEYQFVRGYVTKGGKQVPSYFRDQNVKATHYFSDGIRLAEPEVIRQLDTLALQIIRGRELAAKRTGASANR